MTTVSENELMTRVEGDAPMGRLMRENYWIPFALSENLVVGDAPTPVRLFGENYIAFRAENGQVGFFDELCPHRRASLALGRIEGNGVRCIYHGWKIDVSGCVVEAPTQVQRPEQFAANVRVAHFPVHEAGGIAWVWLGAAAEPAFPDLPFDAEHGVNTNMTVSLLPCNWLQGLEGGSTRCTAPSCIRAGSARSPSERVRSMRLRRSPVDVRRRPRYETEATPYGMRAASLRTVGDGQTYIRLSHYFFPLVIVVPTGYADHTQIFAFTPVDDTHHLVFFGNYGVVPQMAQREFRSVRQDIETDPRNFAAAGGDRSNRWGQDRELMDAGHFTGVARSVIDEDALVQVSMGPIVDRSKENLSSSDVAVAQARRLILDTLAAAEEGELPPGSASAPQVVHVPHPVDGMVDDGASWRQLESVR